MIDSIFYSGQSETLERAIFDTLTELPIMLAENTISSTRTAGDTIEYTLSDRFPKILKSSGISSRDYEAKFARRAMADLAFSAENNYYMIDIKTHRKNTDFNMPNLTSVERLSRFYEENSNHFCIYLIEYETKNIKLMVKKVIFVPIEFLSWNYLTIGALGWGQIQIANTNNIIIQKYSRKSWMLELCNRLVDIFYPKELSKITARINVFQKLIAIWSQKEDVWRNEH